MPHDDAYHKMMATGSIAGVLPHYERKEEREGYTGATKPPIMGPGQPANQVYPCWCQSPMAMALGETAQVREYPEVAEARPFRLRENKHSGGV